MAKDVVCHQPGYLVAEFELVENHLDIRGETVQVGLEIHLELLLFGSGFEVAECEWRGIVESLSRGITKGHVLVDVAYLVKLLFLREDCFFSRLQHSVETTDDGHRQNNVTVLATNIDIAQDVIGDAPDKIGDPIELCTIHWITLRVRITV